MKSLSFSHTILLWLSLVLQQHRVTGFSIAPRSRGLMTSTNHRRDGAPRATRVISTRVRGSAQTDYETEETLLKIHLQVAPGISAPEAKHAVVQYCQSFPFAAVLPVQPLQYLPSAEGVEVKFLRKKTEEKSAVDGGIRFFVAEAKTPTVAVDDDGLEMTAKRNSAGQTIQKIMAERLVITAFVAGMTGEEQDKYGDAPLDRVQVTSLYHKWM